jgi:hypothetical protein
MNQLVGLRTPIPVVSNRSYAEPDALVRRCIREFVRAWPNLSADRGASVQALARRGAERVRPSGQFELPACRGMLDDSLHLTPEEALQLAQALLDAARSLIEGNRTHAVTV